MRSTFKNTDDEFTLGEEFDDGKIKLKNASPYLLYPLLRNN